jgi:AcrR family transcriptional regulator
MDAGTFDRLPQILRVAERAFAERGFRGVSMRDIGAACGVSASALYRYIGGKGDLLFMTIADISTSLTTGATGRLEGATDPRHRLEILVEWHVEQAVQDPHVILVQDREWSHLEPEAQKKIRGLQRTYLELWITTLMEARPGMDASVARAIVQAVIRLINSTPHSARANIEDNQLRAVLTRMANAALWS